MVETVLELPKKNLCCRGLEEGLRLEPVATSETSPLPKHSLCEEFASMRCGEDIPNADSAEMPCQGMWFKWLVWLRYVGMTAGEWLNMSWHVGVCRYCSLEALSRESHWSGLGFGQGLQPSGALSHCFLMHGSEAENAIYITPLAKSQVIIIYVGLKTHMACTHHGSGEWCRHHCTVNECRCHLQHYKLKMAWGQGGYLVELLPPKMSIHFREN